MTRLFANFALIMTKLIRHTLCIMAACLIMAACSDKSDDPQSGIAEANRAVLVYMVADNNLSRWALTDLKEMRSVAAKECEKQNARWIVYYSGPDHKPRLIEFDTGGNEKTLASYSSSELSVSINRMREVINDFKRIAPAKNYGLVFWSHGTGWINDTGSVDEPKSTTGLYSDMSPLSFGYEGTSGARMKVTSLGKALNGNHFEFIYFDCCHMATIEVAYELRHATDLIAASPTELGLEGMPYDKNIPYLLNADLRSAINETYRFYSDQYNNGDGYGCSISLLNIKDIDKFAQATKSILKAGAKLPETYTPIRYFRYGITEGIYDMADYIKALNHETALLSEWQSLYNNMVVETYSTKRVYTLSSEKFNGIGCQIIASEAEAANGGYNELQWWCDVVSAAAFQI